MCDPFDPEKKLFAQADHHELLCPSKRSHVLYPYCIRESKLPTSDSHLTTLNPFSLFFVHQAILPRGPKRHSSTVAIRYLCVIEITDGVLIPESELFFSASRSSGPGGQNVNKVNSRVSLYFDVVQSDALSAWQKQLLRRRLSNRMSREGVLRIVCQQFRSQAANRDVAIERFVQLMRSALQVPSPRRKTSIPVSVKRRRLDEKTRRSRIKRLRSRPQPEDH